MNQRMALIIAGALTALVLVLMLGVGATVAVQSFLVARTTTLPQAQASDTASLQPVATSNTVATNLSANQAARIALNAAPNAALTHAPELVNLQGTVAYQVSLNSGIVYVDANNGAVLFNSTIANIAPTINGSSQRRSGEHSETHEGEDND